MAEVLVLQHHAQEPLGTIRAALTAAGLTPRCILTNEGEPVPPTLGTALGLVVLGGPQSVYEQTQFPFLTEELRLIESALRQDVPILGICLGGQLLAAALGAEVYANTVSEIGWHTVTLAKAAEIDALWQEAPNEFTGFHWHGDIFALPAGSVGLASSSLTPYQAFRYGTQAWGLQCHLEVTTTILQDWCIAYAEDLSKAGLTDEAILPSLAIHLPSMQRLAAGVFGRWAALVTKD
jgi:GMP synthase (glutamine-hydrolysing)